MHICIIPSWYPENSHDVGGSFFREQALALQRYDNKVGVIYPHLFRLREYKKKQRAPKGIIKELDQGMPTYRNYGLGWYHKKIPCGNMNIWVKQGLKLFAEYVKDHGKPDVLHAHSMLNGGVLAEAIKHRYNIPYVITEHNSIYVRRTLKKWEQKVIHKVMTNADYKIAVSEAFANTLSNIVKGNHHWSYIPNILSHQFEAPITTKTPPKHGSFTFCNISMLNKNKRISLLLSAFAESFAGKDSIRLRIAGEGKLRQSLEKLSFTLGIEKQVDFLGMLSRQDVLALMKTSDAYVLSSAVETFSVVLIESLSVGMPVVATRCGGPESIVINNKNGYLVNNNDVTDLANGMKNIIKHYSQFDNAEIRRDCLERFSEATVITALINEYKKIIH